MTDKVNIEDNVNPEHYRKGGMEAIDAIEAMLTPEEFRGMCRGLALKYLWRAPHKGEEETDYAKAAWYAERARKSKIQPLLFVSGSEPGCVHDWDLPTHRWRRCLKCGTRMGGSITPEP